MVSYHSSLFKVDIKNECSYISNMSHDFVVKLFTFVCSIPFLVVVVFVVVIAAVAVSVGVMFIYSCHYEDTSYTLFIYLCKSQWCDDNHDLPQHVR